MPAPCFRSYALFSFDSSANQIKHQISAFKILAFNALLVRGQNRKEFKNLSDAVCSCVLCRFMTLTENFLAIMSPLSEFEMKWATSGLMKWSTETVPVDEDEATRSNANFPLIN